MSEASSPSTTEHTAATLSLAKKEHAEHMHGMTEVRTTMQQRPLQVRAYTVDDPRAPASAKTVHCVRHGQGFHNLLADLAQEQGRTWEQFKVSPTNPYTLPEILDAPLTEKGRQQARLLTKRVAALPSAPELVMFSPNCRALQTGTIVFAACHDIPFIAHEMCREECGVHTCDMRRPVSQQQAEFPQVDFSLLKDHEEDPLFRTDHRETKFEVGERIYQFLEWLEKRPEEHVAINSHSGWLLTMFNGVVECMDPALHAWWQTGEMRSVKLEFCRT